MRQAARGRRREQGSGQWRWLKLLVLAVLCALPLAGSLMLLRLQQPWALIAYAGVSLLAFGCYWRDKRSAQRQQWRTPENTLHALELLGGWPGALVAQQVFRHKTRKVSYQLAFWGIVALHQAFWSDWLLLGGRFSTRLLPQLAGLL